MVDGGYFIKPNGGQSPQDYDMIGLSLSWTGLEVFTTKTDFKNYVNSFSSDGVGAEGKILYLQDAIDTFWNKSLIG